MTAATALSAFNTIVGVLGLGTGVAGLLTPSPLQGQVDGIEDDIDAIKDELDIIGGRIASLEDQVGEGFATAFRATLDAAFEEVKTSYFDLGDLRAERGNVDAQSVIDSVDSSVRGFLTLIEPANIQSVLPVGADGRKAISTIDAGNMIEAVNFAVSLRLTVIQELEDGAIGREEIKSALSDAQTAVATIADGLETYVEQSEDLFDQQYRPVATYTVSLWRAKEIEDSLVGYNASQLGGYNDAILAFRSYPDDSLFNADQISTLLLQSLGDPTRVVNALNHLNSDLPDQQSTWSPRVVNLETNSFETETVVIRYRQDNRAEAIAILDDKLAELTADARANYAAEIDFDALRSPIETFAALSDGEEITYAPGDGPLIGTDGNDLMTGLGLNDIINAGADDDVVRGQGGNDMMRGEAGSDVLDGGLGDDRAEGGADDDVLYGGEGNDSLSGGAGVDQLLGGAGADFLDGGAGADIMAGGLGNDFYVVGSLLDDIRDEIAFSQGGGIDTVRTWANNYVQPDNIELVRITNIDGTQNFNATGNDAPGTLVGNAGNNVLTGRGGNDQINGNAGNDRLIGNTGRDTLVGGAGADTFVYNSISESRAGAAARDVINGFDRGADRIDLSAMDANLGLAGEGVFEFIGTARFDGDGASSAGQLRLQQLGGPNAVLVEGDLRGDGMVDFQVFVNLTTDLSASDFIL